MRYMYIDMEYEIEKTQIFDDWLKNLRNRLAVLAIANRLTRVAAGTFGDHKSVGGRRF